MAPLRVAAAGATSPQQVVDPKAGVPLELTSPSTDRHHGEEAATAHAAAASASIIIEPDNLTPQAGLAFPIFVTRNNGSGAADTTYTGTIHFTSSDPSAALPPDYTFTSADAGDRSFGVTLVSGGNRTITATDTVTGSITGSATVTVAATPPTSISMTQAQDYERVLDFHQVHATATANGGPVPDGTMVRFQPDGPFGLLTDGVAVSIASTPTGDGYWVAYSDGLIENHGAADWYGDSEGVLSSPVVDIVATPTGQGYYLVTNTGLIVPFGDAKFFGDTHAIRLNQEISGMSVTATGLGYRMVAIDGGVFTFGDATFRGSARAQQHAGPIIDIVNATTTDGY